MLTNPTVCARRTTWPDGLPCGLSRHEVIIARLRRTHWLIAESRRMRVLCDGFADAEASMRSHVAPVIILHKNRSQAHARAA